MAAPGETWLEDVVHLDWGPLSLHTHAAVINTRLSYTPGRLGALPGGQSEILLAVSHTNLWGDAPGYFLDMEMMRASFRFHHGLGDGWEIDAELGLLWRGGGFLDEFIEGFHSLLGITQARRDNFARNQLNFTTRDSRGAIRWLDSSNEGLGMANPVIGIRKELISQLRGRPGLTVGAHIKLPFGDRNMNIGLATGGWDFLVDVGLQLPIADPLQLFVVLGFIMSPGDDEALGIPTREFQTVFLIGFEWRIGVNVSFVFHFLRHDGVALPGNNEPLDLATHEFLGGFKWAPGRTDNLVLEFGVIENSIHDANTPDFGFHLAARIRLR
ncbi:MAG: DUF3187 family protein [Planctomycetota bacterium]